MITRGRVLRGAEGARAAKPAAPSARQRRRVAREEVEAHLAAERIVAETSQRCEAVLAHGRATAATTAAAATREAEQREHAKLAALYLALRRAEESESERQLDRSVALAVALAERLLGAALAVEPGHIASLARQALAEARGARRAVIEANPLDAAALRANLASVGILEDGIDVRINSELARGELCLHTDLGTLDAKLTPQLERLAAALRDALR